MGHPTWIYHDTEKAKIVDSDEIPDGWRDSPRASVNEPNPPEETADEAEEETIEVLKARANELGIRVHWRWGADKIRAEIAKAEE